MALLINPARLYVGTTIEKKGVFSDALFTVKNCRF